MKKPQTMNQVWNSLEKFNVLTNLIFNGVPNLSSVLLTNEVLSVELLTKYKTRHISSLVQYYVDKNIVNNTFMDLTLLDNSNIANIILARFKDKWSKLYETLNFDYDPIRPFEIKLEEDVTDTLETVKDKTVYSEQDKVYGFNSITGQPSDESGTSTDREYKRENPRHRDYTRKGNIGNITQQQLIEEQRDVLKYQIKDTILKDIVSVLCNSFYVKEQCYD